MIPAGVSSVASRAVDGHESGVRERALFTTAASRGGRRRVGRVFVPYWLALAGVRARLLRRAGDGGAHVHGSSYPANRQGTEHPLRAIPTTKPYNTYTSIARPRL
jgi:hypothetical protein